MKYLNKFETGNDYKNATLTRPAVSLINEDYFVNYDPVLPVITAGMICYATNEGMLKFCSSENGYSSLGTPVGVCVVPSNHTSDNTARIISLDGVDADGNHSNTEKFTQWGGRADLSLQNKTTVINGDNTINRVLSSNSYGYLPSDKFTDKSNSTVCLLDSHAYYDAYIHEYLIPSPYLEDGSFNTDYSNTVIASSNALSDFNGASNTNELIGLSGILKCFPADMCDMYSVNNILPEHNGYLPACGELGYIIPRFNEINASLEVVSGVLLNSDRNYGSSTEKTATTVYLICTYDGCVQSTTKTRNCFVRPFASIPITPFSI